MRQAPRAASILAVFLYVCLPIAGLWLLSHAQLAVVASWSWEEQRLFGPPNAYSVAFWDHLTAFYGGGYTPEYQDYLERVWLHFLVLNVVFGTGLYFYGLRLSRHGDRLLRNPWVNRLRFRLKGYDSFYSDIPLDMLPRYQLWFDRMLYATEQSGVPVTGHVESETRRLWLPGVARNLAEEASTKEGISATFLQIMLAQYILGDQVNRDLDRPQWVARVLARSPVDTFPDPRAMAAGLFGQQAGSHL